MKPTCKLCETRHWTYEEHGSGPEKVREVGEGVLRNTVTKRAPVTKPVLSDGAEAAFAVGTAPNVRGTGGSSAPSPSAGRGRPKKHKSNAERQRAYRRRK